jgi:CDP-4-dehydro-6-deoxyglucose reductase
VLLCQARAVSTAVAVEARTVSRAGEAEIRNLPCRIERRAILAPDVQQLFLRLPATEQVGFLPGQYLDVLLEDGRRRSFSLACPPHDAGLLEIHVRRVPAGRFTSRLFDELRDGALLRIELPIGQFVYRHDDTPNIFIAGGTGFAPLKSMLRHIFERGPAREVHLYWGARDAADLYEHAWLLGLQSAQSRFRYTPVLSHSRDAPPDYRRGWVHEAVLADYPDLRYHSIYAAGPPQMVEAIRTAFPAAGAAIERLYFDSFDFAPDAARAYAPEAVRAGNEPAT